MAGTGGATAVQQPAATTTGAAGGAGRSGAPDPRAEALRCPRCDSANTKFCYYNNYSLSQPRHFCKACKRYWTRGGTLRNVPVGGGCRKNKRSRTTSSSGAGIAGRTSASASAAGTSSSAASALAPPHNTAGGSSMQSLSSALGLSGGASLASLLLGGGGAGGDHLGLFHAAMQSVVSDSTAYELQQQQNTQSQVDHLLGLGYGSGGASQIQLKPWTSALQQQQDATGGIMDSFYAPLLSGSLVPGLEELHVKAEAAGAGAGAENNHHHQQQQKAGSWEMPPSSNIDANIIASDALMAAASMNHHAVVVSSTAPPATATTTGWSFMYWGGNGGAAAAWPDLANCGSSIATLF